MHPLSTAFLPTKDQIPMQWKLLISLEANNFERRKLIALMVSLHVQKHVKYKGSVTELTDTEEPPCKLVDVTCQRTG